MHNWIFWKAITVRWQHCCTLIEITNIWNSMLFILDYLFFCLNNMKKFTNYFWKIKLNAFIGELCLHFEIHYKGIVFSEDLCLRFYQQFDHCFANSKCTCHYQQRICELEINCIILLISQKIFGIQLVFSVV